MYNTRASKCLNLQICKWYDDYIDHLFIPQYSKFILQLNVRVIYEPKRCAIINIHKYESKFGIELITTKFNQPKYTKTQYR